MLINYVDFILSPQNMSLNYTSIHTNIINAKARLSVCFLRFETQTTLRIAMKLCTCMHRVHAAPSLTKLNNMKENLN